VLSNKKDELVKEYPFAQIKRAAVGDNVVVLLLTNGNLLSLYFESVSSSSLRRSPGLGIIFPLLSLVIDRGKAKMNSEAWAYQLEGLGIEMRRPTATFK
jgi:uncharacterized YccA/Bax inhibitor family protein